MKHPATPMKRGGDVRSLRIGVVMVAAVLAIGLGHGMAQPAAATDCVTYYCATLSVSFTGSGSARVVDDQGEIDCYDNGGSRTGTCSVQYYWIGGLSETLTVTLTVVASANSMVCPSSGPCTQPGGSKSSRYTLTRNDSVAAPFSIDLAKEFTLGSITSGDGAGRITSSPTGIDCVVNAGVASGTCQHTWYFRDSMTVEMTGTPAAGNYVCHLVTGYTCMPVGQAFSFTDGSSFGFTKNEVWSFNKGHPILTVGVDGHGTVVSSPAGISCPSACSKYFAADTNVTLSAAAKSGYVFKGWSGACSGYGPTCNVTVGSTDVSTTAIFGAPATPRPTVRPTPVPTAVPSARPTAAPAPAASAGTPPTADPASPLVAAGSPVVAPSPSSNPSPAMTSADPADPSPAGAPGVVGGVSGPSPEPATPTAGPLVITIEPSVLIVAAVLILLALVIGVWQGRRGRRTASRAAPPG